MCEVIVCERWYVTKLCVCVSVCVKLLYVKFVCVKLLYVRGEAAGGGEATRDTKQEPHTKLWGKKKKKNEQDIV